jgi:hypothetical protein
MFNIINEQRNESQKQNEVIPYPSKLFLKRLKITNADEDVEKRETLHTIDGNDN